MSVSGNYLLSSFTIGLKESCLEFVEKQLQELAEKVYVLWMMLLVTVYNCVMQNPSDLLSELRGVGRGFPGVSGNPLNFWVHCQS